MTDAAFISYRRQPSGPLALLIQEKLKNNHGINAYVDTTRTDSTRVRFPQRLMTAIAETPVFICLLSSTTLESEWVLEEIQQAYDTGRFCIPIFQENYRPPAEITPALDYLLSHDGVHIFDQKNLYVDEAVARIANLISPPINEPLPPPTRGRRWMIWTGFVAIALVVAFVALTLFNQNSNQQSTEEPSTPTDTEQAPDVSDSTSGETATPTVTVTSTSSSTPTPTETATPTATLSPIDLARTPVTQNSAWTPYERDYLGVTMVLVPAGCFMMGSYTGDVDEQPQDEFCFEQPFWFDKLEVSRNAYQRCIDSGRCTEVLYSDYSTRAIQPINRLTWYQARDFCASRGARLPTEAEWEYAARGPNNLQFPWGEAFISDNVVFVDNSDRTTVAINSRPDGASWVGALNMSGNIAEWTNSRYFPYPYDPTDGRELEAANPLEALYVFRGGSFFSQIPNLRTSDRDSSTPRTSNGLIGVRCARDFE